LGSTTALPFCPTLEVFREPRHVAALVIFLHARALAAALGFLFALLSLRRLLRGGRFAMVAWIVMYAVIVFRTSMSGLHWSIGLPAGLAGAAIAACLLDRFGLVALCVMIFTSDILIRTPAALEFSAWYANRSLISLGIVVVIGLYGARTAVGGVGPSAQGLSFRPE